MAKKKRKGGGTKPAPNTATTPSSTNTASSASQPLQPQFKTTGRRPTSSSQGTPSSISIRSFILTVCVCYFVQKALHPTLLPHGPAVKLAERPSFLEIDPTNDSLQGKHGKLTKIYERLDEEGKEPLLKGPETVVVNPKDGTIYVLTEEALLVSLTDLKPHDDKANPKSTTVGNHRDAAEAATTKTASIMTAKATVVVDLGMGRPLGGRFTPDGKTLYVCDAALGLLRITHPHQFPKSKVELVAHQFRDDNGTISKIQYANDLAIGKSGKVYFTDSTNIMSDRIGFRTWDTMYASKTDMMRGKAMGRLLEYDPHTNQIKVLARHLRFANGVGIDKDETFVFVAETFGLRLLKYHLTGSQQGTLETLVESKDMTGYPDGVDCGGAKKRCYAVMPSSVVPLAKIINKLPHPIDMVLRNIVMMLPKKMAPKVKAYGGVVEVDPTTKEIRYFQDADAKDIGFLAGVTVWDNKLYLGSLRNNYVGVYDLN